MTDACNGANGYGGAYGTLFLLETGNCTYGVLYYNVHWGGLLSYSGYPGYSNGAPFYLNTSGSWCTANY